MNLLRHLLLRIVAVALLCLLATTAYVLVSSNQAARQATWRVTESLGKQLSFQQLQMRSGFGHALPFPDFTLWKQTRSVAGICVHFAATGSQKTYDLCNGAELPGTPVPSSFEALYRWFFNPGLALHQTITFKGLEYGVLTVTPSAEMEITQAWENIRRLLGLSVTTVFAVCCLVYLSIRRALRPAQTLVKGLGNLGQGQLSYRLPKFELIEWQRIAEAVNQLAASQQQLLSDRQRLAIQLLETQEEERRYLARELHDEFGQCLAAINAVTASIAQTAEERCPELLAETGQISQITQHLLIGVRGLLARLRPAELDGLGLKASLESLVSAWNARGGGTRYRLVISGDCAALPEALALTVFRIIQECLTNIAKHAAASHAEVKLAISPGAVELDIADDGIATRLPFPPHTGIGLLGIRERATALTGRLALSLVQPHGLRVEVWLPLGPSTGGQT
ncbi:MAG: sensor histidine kinase [Methylobacter sp.]|nr:MAG: sensor histidine kinase [Methylobacter sp.]